jgi:hypothetical protein
MAAVCVSAQNKSAGINLSLWKGAATQPLDTMQTTYLNLGLMSSMNRLHGVGVNALGSVVRGDVNGLQLTGLANLAGGSMRGVQMAGFSNVSGNNSIGLSVAGLVNIAGNDYRGVTIAGLTAIAGDRQSGVMIGGLLNVVGDSSSGVQLSGIANVVGSNFSGLALSGMLNVAGEDVSGLQVAGLANIATKRMNGLQIGLFNYATELHGFQLGLVNANPDTRIQFLLYGGNTTWANVGVRFKNRLFYTIVGIGTMQEGLRDKPTFNASYRAGLSVNLLPKLALSGDLGYQHIETFKNHDDERIPRRLYALQARVNLEYQVTRRVGLFATGGYGITRRYACHSRNFDKGAIVEGGIVVEMRN